MLKITTISNGDETVRVKLEGTLRTPWLEELSAECERSADRGARIEFDLSAVTFVDQECVRFLLGWLQRGAEVGACSGYIAELLRLEIRK